MTTRRFNPDLNVTTALGPDAPDDGDDETDDALTYTLTGEVATSGLFVIAAASGQISVVEGASLDHETKSSYTGKVNWTVQGQEAVADLTINVTDVEATIPDAPTVTRTPSDVQMNPGLDVAWTAANANGLTITGYEAQYRIKVAEGETENTWTAYSGTLSATDTTFNLADLTPGTTYEAQVRARNDEGGSGWSESGRGGIAVLASIHAPNDPVTEGSTVDVPVSLSSSMDVEVTVSWRTAEPLCRISTAHCRPISA